MSGDLIVEVGKIPFRLRIADGEFREAVSERFSRFVTSTPACEPLDLQLTVDPEGLGGQGETVVRSIEGQWRFERAGGFKAVWNRAEGRGYVATCKLGGALAVDSVVRILHTLLLAGQGGFLLHSASVVRNGKAFVFSGVSGAGKSTISGLAPPDVTLLTDEMSMVRADGDGYRAYGTPYVGTLGKPGENVSAPVKALYLLAKGPENKIEPLLRREAAAGILGNILFLADDPELVGNLFETAWPFTDRVPVYRLTFVPTPRVWELIG